MPTPKFNTWEQIQSSGTGVAICWHGRSGRSPIGHYWSIMRFRDGTERVTDKTSPWYARDHKIFSGFDKKESLAEAQAWVLKTYKEAGPWVRNWQGDYIPKRINTEFPLRKNIK